MRMMNVIEGIFNMMFGVVFIWVGWKIYKIFWKYIFYFYLNVRVRVMEVKFLME